MAISRTTHTSDVSYTLPEGVDDLYLTGTDAIDGTGNILDNQIFGNNADNIIQGLEGNDTLLGADGEDIVIGGAGDDQLDGGQGSDSLWGEDGDDSLSGDAGDDALLGGNGFDNLLGGDGNDILEGGAGGDTMIGGAGDDVYSVDDFADIVVEEADTTMVTTILVSVDENGVQGNSGSYIPVFSPDGTKIAFEAGEINSRDVFVKDLNSGLVIRVSTDSNGVQGDNGSHTPIFSPDGTKIAFSSDASNLVADDTNGYADVFVKDLNTGLVTRVSTDSSDLQVSGASGGGDSIFLPLNFSPDGTKIAFVSNAPNLVADDTIRNWDIFVKDLNTGLVTRVSTDSNGVEGNNGSGDNNSYSPVFSPDGTKIAFASNAANLVADDTNGTYDIFVKDLNTGLVTRVSTDSNGLQGNDNSIRTPVFSPDGTKIAFTSYASNLVANDSTNASDIFVKDLNTGFVTLVSTNNDGVQGSSSVDPVFSPDGTKIVFWSNATSLVAGDTNGVEDIFVKDLNSGLITRVSTDRNGVQGNSGSHVPVFSPDGTQIAFQSDATNLVTGDANNSRDIFLATLSVSNFGIDTINASVSYTLPNNVENLILLGKDSLTGAGNELDNIITGTEAGDFIYGYAGNDTLSGALGDDNIEGGVGDDLVFGDDGNDYLVGGEGNDTLVGGNGNDNLSGGAGNNSYIYTNGHDFINNEEYPSPQEDNGVGDLLTIANFARSQAVFSQDIQVTTTLVISFPSSEADSIRINNFFNVDATGKIETYSKDAIETLIFKDGTLLTAAQIVGIFNNTPPQIINDPLNAEVNEDGSITLDLLSNVSDVNGQSLTITKVDLDDPTQGTLGFLDSQEIVFTPAANFNGAVSLTYTVSDGVASVTGKTIIQVMPINDAPTALLPLDEQSVDEGQSFVFTIPTEAFTDIDGDNLAYGASLVDGSPLPSWLSFNDKTQTFNGIPSFSDVGTLQVKVVATDPDGLFTSQIFNLDVNDINQAPIGIDDSILLVTDEDTNLIIDILARVTDPDGDPLTIDSVIATNGSVEINTNQTITYKPNSDFNGTDEITYMVKDDRGAIFTRTETITVNPVNDAPVAVSPSPITNQQVDEAATFSYQIPANAFSDIESDLGEGQLTYTVNGLPDWLSFDDKNRTLVGTPTFNDAGKHTIIVTATDNGGLSASTSFELTINNVNHQPVVDIGTSFIINEDDSTQIIDVMSGISDPDGDTISISNVSVDVSQGVAILNADKTISFTPANDFNGTAIINFVVSDGTALVNSSVEVVVQPVNDAPVLTSTPIDLNDPIEDTSYVLYANDLLQGYTDIDGGILSVIKLTVSNGTLVDNNDGSYVYTPNPDYFGNIQLNYYVSDGIAETPVTRTLNVINQNDAPTGRATAILKNGQEDVAYIVKASDLLQGFSEVDGEALSVINLSANQGTVIDNLDGTFTIQAPQNYNGAINLNYQVTDNTYTLSANQTFVLVPVNDAPNTQDIIGNLQINEGQSFLYALSANSFKDLDGDVLTYTATLENGDPLPSWLIFNQNTLGFSGTPSFSDAGVLQITVVASDGSLTAAQTFALQIQDVNRAPMALDVLGNFSTNEDQSLDNINVLSLVADPDGDPLTVTSAVITAGQGTISINANQTLNFNPTPNFNGSVTISYRVEDGRGGFTDRQDTIVVNPINDAPIAPSTPVVLANGTEDNTYTINLSDLLQGYSDVDADLLQVINLNADNGTLADNQNGTYTFTPDADFNSTVNLSYQVSDGKGGFVNATNSFVVDTVNDAPMIGLPLDDQSIDENQVFSFTIPQESFIDIDSDVLNYTATLEDGSDLPSWLSFDVNTKTFSGTPTFDDAGLLRVKVTANDGQFSTSQVFSLDVVDVNRTPVQVDNSTLVMDEDSGSLTIDVLARVEDLDGDVLTISNVSSNQGSVILNVDNTISFTPSVNFNGTAQVSYQVDDGRGGVLSITENITVNPVNDVPELVSTPATLANGTEDNTYTINVSDLLQGYSDVDGDLLQVINLNADNGTLADNQNGTYTFTPDADFNSTVNLSYQVSDGKGGLVNATNSFVVDVVNDAPMIGLPLDDQTVDENQVFSFTIPEESFIDIDSTVLDYTASLEDGSALPSWLSFDPATRTFSGVPNFDDAGLLRVKVTANDGQFSTSQVFSLDIVDVNRTPVQVDNSTLVMDEDSGSVKIDVLARVQDPDGDIYVISNVNVDAAQGSVVLNADKTISFNPTKDFNGTAQVSYQVDDGRGGVVQITENIVVKPINDAPIAPSTPVVLANGTEDQSYTIQASDLLQGFSDIDGDALAIQNLTANNGTLTVNQNGTYSFTPDADFNGTVNLSYQVSDGKGGLVNATNSFVVDVVNDAPIAPSTPVVLANGTEDQSYLIDVNQLLQGFSDVDGDLLQVLNLSADNGTLTANQNNTYSFIPDTDFNGTVNLSYQVSDGKGGLVNATNSFIVDAVNDAPMIGLPLDDQTVDEKQVFSFTIPQESFIDIDSDVLNYTATLEDGSDLPSWLSFDANTKTFSGTPTFDDAGTHRVKVVASDGQFTTSQVFSVDVVDVNRAPVQVNTSTLVMDEDSDSLTIDVLSRVQDLDGDVLTISNVSSNQGSVILNVDNTISFTPSVNFNGTAQVSYQVDDGRGGVLSITENITVNPVNDVPELVSTPVVLANGTEDNTYTINLSDLLQGYSDVDADLLQVINLNADNGTLADNQNGTYTFTPDADFNSTVNLSYQVSDGKGGFVNATNSFVVDTVNDAPMIGLPLDDQSIDENQVFSFTIPQESFIDIDSDVLNYTATLEDGSDLPSWLSFDANTKTFSGTPSFDDAGSLRIKVTASDGQFTTSQVFSLDVVDVNRTPVQVDNSTLVMDEDSGSVKIDVLARVQDPDGDIYVISNVNVDAAQGSVVLNADKTISFTPTKDFNGTAQVSYQVDDGRGGVVQITENIVVNPINDAPIAPSTPVVLANGTEDQSYLIDVNQLLQGFSDVDGDLLQILNLSADNGTLTANQNNTYSFTPDTDFNGTVNLSYQVSDSKGGIVNATNSFVVDTVNDAPMTGLPLDDQSIDENQPFSFTIPQESFIDIDSNVLNYSAVLIDNTGNETALPSWLSFDANTKTFSGTPTFDDAGLLRVKVTANDGQFSTSQVFSLDVVDVNRTPVQVDNSTLVMDEDSGSLTIDVLARVEDLDGDVLTISNVSSNQGSVILNVDNTISFTPSVNFNGTAQVSYQVDDGRGGVLSITENITVNPVNDVPELVSTPATLANGTEDNTYTINVSDLLQGYSDVDGDLLQVINLNADNGTLADNQNGTYTFTPDTDFNGTVNLSYQVSDSKGGIVNATNSFVVDTVNDAPMTGLPLDDQSIDENQPFSFTIPQESFIDIDSNVLNYSAVLIDNTGNETALPSWLSFDANTKTFSGTPTFDDAGLLRVKVTANDGQFSTSQVFSLDVVDVNRTPVQVDNSTLVMDEDSGSLTIDVLARVEDLDGDVLTISNVSSNQGSVILNVDNTISFTPSVNFNGTAQVSYQVDDGRGGVLSITENITVNPVNDVPELVSTPATLANGTEDNTYTINVSDLLQGYSDVDGDLLQVINLNADNGTLADNQNGTYTFTPDADFNGTVNLSYQVSDGKGGFVNATNSFVVDAVNDAPMTGLPLNDQSIDENQPFSFTIPQESFIDIDSNVLNYSAVLIDNTGNETALPSWLSFDANTKTFSGTPTFDDAGLLRVKVTANDGQFSTSQVFSLDVVDVNRTPVQVDNSTLVMDEDSGSLTIDVLARVEDLDGDVLTISNVSSNQGSVILNVDNTISFTPSVNFNGTAQVSYQVDDGRGGVLSITENITVNPVNDVPELVSTPATLANGTEDNTYTINVSDLLQGYSDVDGDLLQVINLNADNGTLADNQNGTYTFTPDADFNGTVNLSYQVSDGKGGFVNATNSFVVDTVNDAPMIGLPLDDQSIDENQVFSFTIPQESFIDIDSDVLNYSAVLIDNTGNETALPNWLSFDVNTKTFSGTPSFDDAGSLRIKVTASDGQFTTSQVFSVDVVDVNRAPVQVDNSTLVIDEDSGSLTIDVLARVEDLDGDVLTISNVSSNQGSVILNVDNTISFTPSVNFNGTAQVSYQVDDGRGGVLSITENITVNPVNDVPKLVSTPVVLANGTEDNTYTINLSDLLQGYSDVDGDLLQVINLNADNGTLADNQNGTYTFTPDADFNGTVNLSYQVSDGKGGLVNATNSFVVDAVNDAPMIGLPLDDQTIDENQVFSFTIPPESFIDIDSDVLNYTATLEDGSDLPSWLSFDANTKTFSGTPSFDDAGLLRVKVTASDGQFTTSQVFSVDVVDVNRAPVQVDNSTLVIDEDSGSLTIDVLARVEDLDGDVLTISNVSSNQGSVILNVDNTISFTPSVNFNGTAQVSYQVDDGRGGVLSITENITVNPVNDVPELVSTPATLANGTEDNTYTINVSDLLQGYSDVDGDLLQVINLNADNGTLADNQNGTYTFTPDADFNSTVNLSYQVSDGKGGFVNATNSFVVDAVNDAPMIGLPLDDQTIDENQVFSFTIPPESFIDIDSDVLNYTATLEDGSDLPSWLSFDANTKTFSGTPSFDDAGLLRVKVTASDGQFTTSQVFSVDVVDVNRAPVQVDNSTLVIDEDSGSLTIDVLARVEDLDGDVLTISNVSSNQGSVILNVDNTISFTPSVNFNGTAQVSYQVDDGRGGVLSITENITVNPVNDVPELVSTPATLANGTEDNTYTINVSDLLQGYSDVDGDLLQVINLNADNGTLADNQNGTYTFTPDADFNSTVNLSYQVSDGKGGFVNATNSFVVDAVNDAPMTGLPLNDQSIDENQPFSFTIPQESFIDIDSNVLNYSAVLIDNTGNETALPSWLSFDANTKTFSGTPTFDDAGLLRVKVTANDGQFSTSQVFSLDVVDVNRTPVQVDNSTLVMDEDSGSLTIDVLARVEDLDGDVLTISNVNVDAAQGSVVLNANKTISFTPTKDFNGTAQVSYQVDDGRGGVVQITENIVVNPVNDAPVLSSTAALLPNGTEDQSYTIQVSDLLQGFSDVDGGSLSVVNLQATNGSLVDNQNGSYTFSPTKDFNGTVQLSYQVNDGNNGLTSASNSFVINAVNDAPVLSSTPVVLANGTEDQSYLIDVNQLLQGFSDVDGGSLSVVNLQATNGSLVDNQNGSYTFSPTKDFNGTVQLTYQVSDGNNGLTSASNSFVINAVNDAPVLSSTPVVLANGTEDQSYLIDVNQLLQGFSDVDGGTLSVVNLQATNGSLVDNQNGTYSFNPTKDFNGTVNLSYQVSDGNNGLTAASNSFVINAVNDAPVLFSSPAVLPNGTEDQSYTIQVSDLLQGFSDVDGGTLSVVNLQATNGSLVDNQNGTYSFNPTKDFNGTIQLTYQVSDGNNGLTSATNSFVVDAVNDAPVLSSTAAVLPNGTEDQSYLIDVNQLLQGFSDVDGGTLSVVNLQATNGSLVDNQNGTYSFNPTKDFNGTIQLTYQVSDGNNGLTSATNSFVVDAVNDAPVLSSTAAVLPNGTEDQSYLIDVNQLLQGFSDVDGGTLSVVNLQATNGSLVDNQNGTYSFNPTKDFNDTIQLTYQVSDGNNGLTSASNSFVINAVNDAPTINNTIQSFSINEGQTLSYVVPNDAFIDVDGDTLTYNLTMANGNSLPTWLTFDAANKTISLAPSFDDAGLISLKLTANDGLVSTTQQFDLNVRNVNRVPTQINNSAFEIDEDSGDVVIDVLSRVQDLDKDNLTVRNVSLASGQGSITLNQNQQIIFTPAQDFNGQASITYEVIDNQGGVLAITETITVKSINDAPRLVSTPAILADGLEDTDYQLTTLSLLQGFNDVDNDNLVVQNLTSSQGTFINNGNGIFVFKPQANINGDIQFSYQISDSKGGVIEASSHFNMKAVNDAPFVTIKNPSSTARIREDATSVLVALAFGVILEDVDADNFTRLEVSMQQFTPKDLLSVIVDGTNLQASYNAILGKLVVTGSDSLANYQKVLDSLALSTTAEQGATERTIQITISDGKVAHSNQFVVPVDYVQDETHQGGTGNDTLNGSDGNDTLRGGEGDDILNGGNGNDLLFGEGGNDILNGGDGQDTMDGGAGNDIFIVDNQQDVVSDSSGNDQVQSTISFTLPEGIEKLIFSGLQSALVGQGNNGNNQMQSGNGGSELNGQGGDDTLQDGLGRDIFTGGQGADTFDFSQLQNGTLRLGEVLDFSAARGDKIDVSKIDANVLVAGNQAFSFIGDQAFHNTAGELRFSQRLLQGDINGDGKADFEIKLVGVLELQDKDILL